MVDIPALTVRTVAFSKSGNDPLHDPIRLPTGKTVSETGIEELRGILARFEIPGAWTEGRAIIVARYAELIKEVYDAAGIAAVKDYLAKKEST